MIDDLLAKPTRTVRIVLPKRRRKAGRVFLTTFLVTLGIIAFLILVQVI